jgi:hypothetical protein
MPQEDRPRRRGRDEDDPDEEDEYDDQPRRSKGGSWLPLILGIGGGVLVLGVILVVLIVMMGGGAGVTEANFDRLKEGMAEAELTAILGTPRDASGDANPFAGFAAPLGGRDKRPNAKILEWKGGGGRVVAVLLGGKASMIFGEFKSGGVPKTRSKGLGFDF